MKMQNWWRTRQGCCEEAALTHHSQELAHVEINAVVEGEEAADHQGEDEEEQRQIHHSLASPVS